MTFYIVKEKKALKVPIATFDIFCPTHVEKTTLTFKLTVPGLADQVIDSAQAAVSYGIRYEHK